MQVAAELGVPLDSKRYWVWQQRQNKTYRPTSRLKPDEESAMIVDLREHRETGVRLQQQCRETICVAFVLGLCVMVDLRKHRKTGVRMWQQQQQQQQAGL
jgi:hypothetical protein